MASPFFIVGPTAVGKTGIAVAVAERCSAEIVNADAFQLYAGLDLLTAKPSAEEQRRVPHHLIGTVPLSEPYSVARYQIEAQRCLDDIARRKRLAIVVGGSGMYVKSLTHGLSPLPPAHPALRAALETLDEEALLRRLRILDPVTADTIDGKNKRRLIRAIEVCEVTGQRFSEFREPWYSKTSRRGFNGAYLMRNKTELDARIARRVHHMFAQSVIEEIQAARGSSLAETASRMIGWVQVQSYLAGKISLKKCTDEIEAATRQYAKRQITWFKRENAFEKIVLSEDGNDAPAVQLICERLLQ